MHLAAGLSVGLSGVAAGYTIGVVGDAVRIPILCALTSYTALITILGCSGIHATVTRLRRHDFDSYFRRSSGSLRVST
jgi:hypothetical protein